MIAIAWQFVCGPRRVVRCFACVGTVVEYKWGKCCGRSSEQVSVSGIGQAPVVVVC